MGKVLALLLLSLHVFALEPIRPTYQDVSLKMLDASGSYLYKWYRGKTANQVERGAMESLLYGVAVPEAIRFIRDIPACDQVMGYAYSNFSKITAKLGGGYEDNSLLSKVWEIGLGGRHYQFERSILQRVRDCVVSTKVAHMCAVSPFLTKDFADLLNISVKDGNCVKGSDVVVLPPSELFNDKYGDSFPIQIRTPQKTLTDAQHALLHATHEAHAAVTKWRCGEAPKPQDGIVEAAHKAFEASALDKEQQSFFMMRKFSGVVDPLLPKAYECAWAKVQDKHHLLWMDAVGHADRKTAWRLSRQEENNHLLSHICMNLDSSEYKVQFSCGKKRILDCEEYSCDEALFRESIVSQDQAQEFLDNQDFEDLS